MLGAPLSRCPFFFVGYIIFKDVMGRSNKKSNLLEIRSLVENLSDRDTKVKRDIRLFEEFFKSFPIPVSIWSVTSEGTVVSQRGNGLICHDAKCIDSLFSEFDEKNNYVEAHKLALTGQSFQGMTFCQDKTFYVSIAPRRDDQGGISGAIGLAWDVSPNKKMLDNLKESIEIIESDADMSMKLMSVKNLLEDSLETSRLRKMLQDNGEKK